MTKYKFENEREMVEYFYEVLDYECLYIKLVDEHERVLRSYKLKETQRQANETIKLNLYKRLGELKNRIDEIPIRDILAEADTLRLEVDKSLSSREKASYTLHTRMAWEKYHQYTYNKDSYKEPKTKNINLVSIMFPSIGMIKTIRKMLNERKRVN